MIRFAVAVFCLLNIGALLNLLTNNQRSVSLREAVEQNPRFSAGWMELGLEAERGGQLEEAEAELLRAAHYDHRFLPAWTLANFYFRRNNQEEFWTWAPQAARLTYDDYRPLLRLCDALEGDPQRVIARLGASGRLVRAYADLLIREQRRKEAEQLLAGVESR